MALPICFFKELPEIFEGQWLNFLHIISNTDPHLTLVRSQIPQSSYIYI